MKKFSLILMATAASVLGFGGAASAVDPYPPGSTATATPASGPPGYTITVDVDDCTPPEVLTVTLAGEASTATCSAPASALGGGTATTTIKAPSAAGTYTGTIAGTAGFVGSFQVQVVAAPPPTNTLPDTGSSGVSTTTILALGLFGVGAGLFGVAQVRRRQTVSA